MASNYSSVLIFGPTGDVGSATALEAHRRGAHVYLAMRDPSKSIPGLSPEDEKVGNFTRIKVDLADPASVQQAVLDSPDVKAVFLYCAFTPDFMRGTIRALKDAGIEYIVFLSSLTFMGDPKQVEQEDVIPYIHAQIEIAIEEAGIASVALRPAQFATNPFKQNLDKSKTPWQASVRNGSYQIDCIVPADIGRVAGSVLLRKPSTAAKEVIYLAGPEVRTLSDVWDMIGHVTDTDIEVVRPTPEEDREYMLARGVPPPIVDYIVYGNGRHQGMVICSDPCYEEAVANIEKYSGYEPTKFVDFLASYSL